MSNEHFIKFLYLLDKSYIPPSRQTLTNVMIPTYLYKAKEIIKNEISTNESVCLSIDGWSCNYTSNKYLSLTCHYLFNNKLKSAVLKLEQFNESHNAENIKNYIIDSKNEWELDKFGSVFIISDNAGDMIRGIELSGNAKLGCCVHRMDKVIKNTIERVDVYNKLVAKVKNTCTKFRTTPILANLLQSIQIQELGSSLKVLNSVDTRFFTDLLMIKRFYQIRGEIEGVIEAYASEESNDIQQFILSSFTFTDNEYLLLKYFIDIFEIIYSKSEILSSDTFPTLCDLIPIIKSLRMWLQNKQNDLEDNQNEISLISHNVTLTINENMYTSYIEIENIQPQQNYSISQSNYEDNIYSIKYDFLTKIIDNLEKQFYIGNNNIMNNKYCLIFTFINPKYKNLYFNESQLNDVIGFIKEDFENVDDIQISQNITNQSQMNNQFEEDIMDYGIEHSGITKSELTIDEEIECYLKKEKVGKNADISFVLQFWENNKNELKMLYKISRKYLMNLCSSCSSERLFSMSGTFFEKRRTRMLGSTLESECLLKSFIDNNGINQLI